MNFVPCDNVPRTQEEYMQIYRCIQQKADCIQNQYWMLKHLQQISSTPEQELTPENMKFKSFMFKWFQTFRPFSNVHEFKSDAGLALFALDGKWSSQARRTLDRLKRLETPDTDSMQIVNPIPIKKGSFGIHKKKRRHQKDFNRFEHPIRCCPVDDCQPSIDESVTRCVTPVQTRKPLDCNSKSTPEEKARSIVLSSML